jgi:hemolysin-activating ACP:hemolysin acyltransferase
MARQRSNGDGERTEPHLLQNATQSLALQVADYGRARTLRQIMGLLERAPELTSVLVDSLDWRLMAPLGVSQCRLIWDNHLLAGFVTWANLDPDQAAELDQADELRIEPADWRSGDEPWVVDACILPGSEPALAAMFDTLFPNGVRQFARGLNVRIESADATNPDAGGSPEAA